MNINAGSISLVLFCPAWKRWGAATTVEPGTVILHSGADEVVPFSNSAELVRSSSLPPESLIVVGYEHRLADPESLIKMLYVPTPRFSAHFMNRLRAARRWSGE